MRDIFKGDNLSMYIYDFIVKYGMLFGVITVLFVGIVVIIEVPKTMEKKKEEIEIW